MKHVQQQPKLSIIIPTRNEVAFIGRCLESIFAADPVSGGMEIFVVDGMSVDGTRAIVQSWMQRVSFLYLVDNRCRIVPSAMNIGIQAARGDWVIRLDAHSEYPTNYFTRCIEKIQKTGADNVGGCVTTLFEIEGYQRKLVQALTTHTFGVGNSTFRTGGREGWVDTVPFGCYRRDVFARVGLYDERLVRNQDYEFNRRLLARGGRIWFDPSIKVIYHNQTTLEGLFRQAFVTGKWNPWMWFIAPYSFAWRHAIPMLFTAALVTGLLLIFTRSMFAWYFLAAMLLPYLILALAASLQQSWRFGATLSFSLPGLFFLYHLVYGLGGLWGLWRVVIRRTPVQTNA